MFAWSKPSEQAPAEGASPSEVARYVEDLYGEFLWELADTEKKAFLHGLCKQKGWRLNDVARCLGQGPLAVVAGDVSPVKDAADQPNPVAVGVVAEPLPARRSAIHQRSKPRGGHHLSPVSGLPPLRHWPIPPVTGRYHRGATPCSAWRPADGPP